MLLAIIVIQVTLQKNPDQISYSLIFCYLCDYFPLGHQIFQPSNLVLSKPKPRSASHVSAIHWRQRGMFYLFLNSLYLFEYADVLFQYSCPILKLTNCDLGCLTVVVMDDRWLEWPPLFLGWAFIQFFMIGARVYCNRLLFNRIIGFSGVYSQTIKACIRGIAPGEAFAWFILRGRVPNSIRNCWRSQGKETLRTGTAFF